MKAYKLFRTKKSKPGALFPLFVLAEEEVSMGVWLDAKCGELTQDGKVKSKLGDLCYRPGWHLSDVPCAVHIGIRENGIINYMHDSHVWCECEYSDGIDYQDEANANGCRKDGTINKTKAMLKRIPRDGFYRYKTSPHMLGDWIIAGSMKVVRVLNDNEVSDICASYGIVPLLHKEKFDYSVFDKS